MICHAAVYQFDGWIFEYSDFRKWPLRNDGEPRKYAGAKFSEMIRKFDKLSYERQQKHRYTKFLLD